MAFLGDYENPQPYIQNRTCWCWTVCAKIVGFHYANRAWENGSGKVRTDCARGIRLPYVQLAHGAYYVDAWQRAIAVHANTVRTGVEDDFAENDQGKIRALKYAVTGDADGAGIQACTIGHVDDPLPLPERHPGCLDTIFRSGHWAVGNYRVAANGTTHSVVLFPCEESRIGLYDPWDGFADIYRTEQLFKYGFLTNWGPGVIQWVQYID